MIQRAILLTEKYSYEQDYKGQGGLSSAASGFVEGDGAVKGGAVLIAFFSGSIAGETVHVTL